MELTVSYKYEHAVFILRGQIPHLGHLENVKAALALSRKIIICFGSSHRARTFKNPFTWVERKDLFIEAMVDEFIDNPSKSPLSDYPEFRLSAAELSQRVIFIPLRDYMYNDSKWHLDICRKVVEHGAKNDKSTAIVGHYKDDSSYYLDMFPHWSHIRVKNIGGLNSTSFRDEYFVNGCIKSEGIPLRVVEALKKHEKQEFYEDIKKQYESEKSYYEERQSNKFPVIDVTVDSVVHKSNHILLIKRKKHPGKGLWALPGGYLGFQENIQKAAIRELKEETKIGLPKATLYKNVKDFSHFSHPMRDPRGRVITFAHYIDLGIVGDLPTVKGADDAEEAKFWPIQELYEIEDQLFSDHWDIIHHFIS